jgi:hypothetical protein
VDLDEVLAATFSLVAPHLTERQRRLLFGAAARALGYGGVSRVARLAGASRPTVRRGAAELDQPVDPRGASASTAGGPSCPGLELSGLGVRDHLSGRSQGRGGR